MNMPRLEENELLKEDLLQRIGNALKEIHASILPPSPPSPPGLTEPYEIILTTSLPCVTDLCQAVYETLCHGLRLKNRGIWPLALEITRRSGISEISGLVNVKTDKARGRAWLLLALNEFSLESYFRFLSENPNVRQKFYNQSSLIRDENCLQALLMLLAGLEYVQFQNAIDLPFLDHTFSNRKEDADRHLPEEFKSDEATGFVEDPATISIDSSSRNSDSSGRRHSSLTEFINDDLLTSEHFKIRGDPDEPLRTNQSLPPLPPLDRPLLDSDKASSRAVRGKIVAGESFHDGHSETNAPSAAASVSSAAASFAASIDRHILGIVEGSVASNEGLVGATGVTIDSTVKNEVKSRKSIPATIGGRIERISKIRSDPEEELEVISSTRTKRQSRRREGTDDREDDRYSLYDRPVEAGLDAVVSDSLSIERRAVKGNSTQLSRLRREKSAGNSPRSSREPEGRNDRTKAEASDEDGDSSAELIKVLDRLNEEDVREEKGIAWKSSRGKERKGVTGRESESLRPAFVTEVSWAEVREDDEERNWRRPIPTPAEVLGFEDLEREFEKTKLDDPRKQRTEKDINAPQRASFGRENQYWKREKESIPPIDKKGKKLNVEKEKRVEGNSSNSKESNELEFKVSHFSEINLSSSTGGFKDEEKTLDCDEKYIRDIKAACDEIIPEMHFSLFDQSKSSSTSSSSLEFKRLRPAFALDSEVSVDLMESKPLSAMLTSTESTNWHDAGFATKPSAEATLPTQISDENGATPLTTAWNETEGIQPMRANYSPERVCGSMNRVNQMLNEIERKRAIERKPSLPEPIVEVVPESLSLTNNQLLLIDLHVLEVDGEELEATFGFFIGHSNGSSRSRVLVVSDRGIYSIVKTKKSQAVDHEELEFEKEYALPYFRLDRVDMGLGMQYLTLYPMPPDGAYPAVLKPLHIATGNQAKSHSILDKISSHAPFAEICADINKQKASLRRAACNELSKSSNSFTTVDSSLLFYALTFFDDGQMAESPSVRKSSKLPSAGSIKKSPYAGRGKSPSSTSSSSSEASKEEATMDGIMAMKPNAGYIPPAVTAAMSTIKNTLASVSSVAFQLPTPPPTSSNGASSWPRSYFVLKNGNLLSLAAGEKEFGPVLLLSDVDSVQNSEDGDYSFTIFLKDGSSLVFRTETNVEMQRWINVFRSNLEKPLDFNVDALSTFTSGSVVLTPQGLIFCHQDLDSDFVRPLLSVPLTEVLALSIDTESDFFCCLTLDDKSSEFKETDPKSRCIFFLAEKERQLFVDALCSAWAKVFQVPMPVEVMEDLDVLHELRTFSLKYTKLLQNSFSS